MRNEGIVVRGKPLGERSRLVRLFTHQGIVNGIVNGISRQQIHRLAWATPLARCEYIWSRKGNDLWYISDATLAG